MKIKKTVTTNTPLSKTMHDFQILPNATFNLKHQSYLMKRSNASIANVDAKETDHTFNK